VRGGVVGSSEGSAEGSAGPGIMALVLMGRVSAGRGFANDRCGCPGRAGTVWTTTSVDIRVNFNPDGWSDPAHVELTPMPTVNNAMASAHAAVAKVFATVVRLNIVNPFFASRGVIISRRLYTNSDH
jgi:hypothetical protein